jgi:hypothetical protein
MIKKIPKKDDLFTKDLEDSFPCPTRSLEQFLVNESGITEEGVRYDYYYDSPHGRFYVQKEGGIIDIGSVAPCLVDVGRIRFREYKPKNFSKNNFKK